MNEPEEQVVQGNFIHMYRTAMQSEVGESDEVLGFWVRLLLAANWKSAWFKGQRIQPGQLILSDRGMQSRLYPECQAPPAIATIKRRLERLKASDMIEIDATIGRSGGRLVTVKNWSKYQHRNSTKNALDFGANVSANTGANVNANPGANVSADRRRVRRTKKGKKEGADTSAVSVSRKKPKFDALTVELPTPLDTDRFRQSWSDWAQDREDRRNPLTETAAHRQLKKLAMWGEAKAVQAIDNSIQAGWTGLFEPEPPKSAANQRGDQTDWINRGAGRQPTDLAAEARKRKAQREGGQ